MLFRRLNRLRVRKGCVAWFSDLPSRAWVAYLACLALCGVVREPTWATAAELVSVDSAGVQANDRSDENAISSNGRFVVFESKANNLVSGDDNARDDIFVHDRFLGKTVRVSVSSEGVAANDDCANPTISPDGRFVAWDSRANNLVPDDNNGTRDVFLHDRDTDTDGIFDEPDAISTTRASVDEFGAERNRVSRKPALAEGALWVAFEAEAASTDQDIRIFDRQSGTSRIMSIDSAGTVGTGKSENPQISASGQYLVFESSSPNLVADDTNLRIDVFHVDRDSDGNGVFDEAGGITTTRASVASDGTESNQPSRDPNVSDDGRHVVFSSTANNLVPEISNGSRRDIFVRDMDLGETRRLSLGPGGAEGDGDSNVPSISPDGRCVVFQSAATTLVADDTNNRRDIFFVDRDTDDNGTFDESAGTEMLRLSVGLSGEESNGDSGDRGGTPVRPSLAAYGGATSFVSAATNLVPEDTNGSRDVFVEATPCATSEPLLFVEKEGSCGEFEPCYATVPGALAQTVGDTTLYLAIGDYDEAVAFAFPASQSATFEGGYSADFAERPTAAIVISSTPRPGRTRLPQLTIQKGSLVIQ